MSTRWPFPEESVSSLKVLPSERTAIEEDESVLTLLSIAGRGDMLAEISVTPKEELSPGDMVVAEERWSSVKITRGASENCSLSMMVVSGDGILHSMNG